MSKYQKSEYYADPDYLLTVEVFDENYGDHGDYVSVEVGYAYELGRGKNKTIKIALSPGDYEKQLLFEANNIELKRFSRVIPEGLGQPSQEQKPTFKPAAALAR